MGLCQYVNLCFHCVMLVSMYHHIDWYKIQSSERNSILGIFANPIMRKAGALLIFEWILFSRRVGTMKHSQNNKHNSQVVGREKLFGAPRSKQYSWSHKQKRCIVYILIKASTEKSGWQATNMKKNGWQTTNGWSSLHSALAQFWGSALILTASSWNADVKRLLYGKCFS